MIGRRLQRSLVGLACVAVVALSLSTADAAAPVAAKDDDGSFSQTRTLTRTFADPDGTLETVSSYDVTVEADQTKNLRGRQRVRISWSGAPPSGGRASNPFGENGLLQEYPVMIMECRGTDDPSLPVAKQVQPDTCWTAAVAERSQLTRSSSDAIWTKDLDATDADRQRVSGLVPFPSDTQCPAADTDPYYSHLTPFVSQKAGKVYPACSATTMPPEAAVGSAYPPHEVAAFTDLDGNGSTQFEVRSNLENESLGCSDKVACSIVVIPILGLSCAQPDSTTLSAADQNCRKTGQFAPGSSNFANLGVDQAVSPSLWWSASNWANRFSIPITFGLPPNTCDILDNRPPVGFFGSELLAQAALQWAPAYCLDKKRFKFQLSTLPDQAGFNLMDSGAEPAAEVSSAHTGTSPDPVGYAPTAATGFAISYDIDNPDNNGEYTHLRLDARLVAKLLSQSYRASDLGTAHPGLADNPIGIMNDPEFIKLNPGLSQIPQEAGATLLALNTPSDVMTQLTSYIEQDKDAAAFLNGKADPWGMRVNPSYRGIKLPVDVWPLRDNYIPKTDSECRNANPSVYFNQIAAPVSSLRVIAQALLDSQPYVQTNCIRDLTTNSFRFTRVDRQSFGSRFMLGITSLGDSARYGLRTAALQTAPGRFVAPSDASLGAAVKLTEQARPLGPFALSQAAVKKSRTAYPGTMVVYTAAKLRNLAQEQADDVASFMRISTSEGQKVGSGNGQLPRGFLPITRTGPTAKLWASAQAVATRVEAQTPAKAPPTTDPPTGPKTAPPSAPAGSTPPAPPAPVASTPPTAEPPPTQAPAKPVVDTPAATAQTVPAAATESISSGTAARLLPALLGLGLLGLLCTLGSRFFVRPPRRIT